MNANDAYLKLLRELTTNRSPHDVASPRNQGTLEILARISTVDMDSPVVTIPARELDYQFMAAEAYWILSGDRRLSHQSLVKNLLKYSDDGNTMNGAYGPPFLQQVKYVVYKLHEDVMSRQAVMTLWERSPRVSKDIPCTISLQFILRRGYIHTNVFMRSSDAWLGWPYDIFTFTMMTHYVRGSLNIGLDMGTLSLFAGSQHLYVRNMAQATKLAATEDHGDNLVISTHHILHPGDLMDCLSVIRNDKSDCAIAQMRKLLCH